MDFPFSLRQYTNEKIHVLMLMSLSLCGFMFLCHKVVLFAGNKRFLIPVWIRSENDCVIMVRTFIHK